MRRDSSVKSLRASSQSLTPSLAAAASRWATAAAASGSRSRSPAATTTRAATGSPSSGGAGVSAVDLVGRDPAVGAREREHGDADDLELLAAERHPVARPQPHAERQRAVERQLARPPREPAVDHQRAVDRRARRQRRRRRAGRAPPAAATRTSRRGSAGLGDLRQRRRRGDRGGRAHHGQVGAVRRAHEVVERLLHHRAQVQRHEQRAGGDRDHEPGQRGLERPLAQVGADQAAGGAQHQPSSGSTRPIAASASASPSRSDSPTTAPSRIRSTRPAALATRRSWVTSTIA